MFAPQLLPCPFCGKHAEMIVTSTVTKTKIRIGCLTEDCLLHLFKCRWKFLNPEWAVNAWNRRPMRINT